MKVEVTKCQAKDQMTIWYEADNENWGDAVVVITIADLPVLKYDVTLFGLPNTKEVGHEVTVNFHSLI